MFLVFKGEKEIIICSKSKVLAQISKLMLAGILINLKNISGGPFRFKYAFNRIKGKCFVNLDSYTRQIMDVLMLEALDRYEGNCTDYLSILKHFIRSI